MINSTFTIQASFSFIESFDVPQLFGILSKKYALKLSEVPEKYIKSTAAFNQIRKSMHLKNIDLAFFQTTNGKMFLTQYLEELRLLKPEYREKLVPDAVIHLLSYGLDVLIDNKSSHPKPVTLDAFEIYGSEQLMHTVRVLKQPLKSGEMLVLNNDADESFTEDYVYIADYWALKDGEMEFHYQDWEAENDEDANKLHQSTIDGATFISQFSRTAYEITDLLKKVANALNVDPSSLK